MAGQTTPPARGADRNDAASVVQTCDADAGRSECPAAQHTAGGHPAGAGVSDDKNDTLPEEPTSIRCPLGTRWSGPLLTRMQTLIGVRRSSALSGPSRMLRQRCACSLPAARIWVVGTTSTRSATSVAVRTRAACLPRMGKCSPGQRLVLSIPYRRKSNLGRCSSSGNGSNVGSRRKFPYRSFVLMIARAWQWLYFGNPREIWTKQNNGKASA
jgi:hypothetical protein